MSTKSWPRISSSCRRPPAGCCFVLVMLAHQRRRVVHVAVTEHPTAAWTAQQLREAFPWDRAPRYLIRDRDLAFAAVHATADAIAITEVLTAPRSPWQNGVSNGSSDRSAASALETRIIFTAVGLQRLLTRYVDYFERSRTHLALHKKTHPSRARSRHQPRAESWPSRRSVVFVIDTTGSRHSICCVVNDATVSGQQIGPARV